MRRVINSTVIIVLFITIPFLLLTRNAKKSIHIFVNLFSFIAITSCTQEENIILKNKIEFVTITSIISSIFIYLLYGAQRQLYSYLKAIFIISIVTLIIYCYKIIKKRWVEKYKER